MIHPRYMDPKQGPSQAAIQAMTPTRERFPINRNFESTPSRYLEPKTPRSKEAPIIGAEECTFDVRKHKEPANVKYPDLHPRYMDEKNYQPRADSPRRLIESRISEVKRERALWRGDTVCGKYRTFDDLRRQTAKVEEAQPKTKPIVVQARYMSQGTAAQPYPDTDSPRRRPHSPARTTQRHWHSAGVECTTFDRHQKDTAQRAWFAKQERRVSEIANRKVYVAPNNVPRVASLALAEQVKQASLHEQQQALYGIDDENLHTELRA